MMFTNCTYTELHVGLTTTTPAVCLLVYIVDRALLAVVISVHRQMTIIDHLYFL